MDIFPILAIIGQGIFGLYWIYNGVNHLAHHKMLAGYTQTKNVPMPLTAVIITGLLLIGGGLSILTGWYLVYGLTAIVIFLLGVTFRMHDFWNEKDPNAKMMNMILFMRNIALLGATLMMYYWEFDWPWTLEL